MGRGTCTDIESQIYIVYSELFVGSIQILLGFPSQLPF